MYFFKNGTGWCVRHDPNKKVPSRKSQAPVFRKQELKRSSVQAFEPTDAGLKPNGQGFKLQARALKRQDP